MPAIVQPSFKAPNLVGFAATYSARTKQRSNTSVDATRFRFMLRLPNPAHHAQPERKSPSVWLLAIDAETAENNTLSASLIRSNGQIEHKDKKAIQRANCDEQPARPLWRFSIVIRLLVAAENRLSWPGHLPGSLTARQFSRIRYPRRTRASSQGTPPRLSPGRAHDPASDTVR